MYAYSRVLGGCVLSSVRYPCTGVPRNFPGERLVIHCRKTSVSAAHATHCATLQPMSAAYMSIFRMDSNSTSYGSCTSHCEHHNPLTSWPTADFITALESCIASSLLVPRQRLGSHFIQKFVPAGVNIDPLPTTGIGLGRSVQGHSPLEV